MAIKSNPQRLYTEEQLKTHMDKAALIGASVRQKQLEGNESISINDELTAYWEENIKK